MSGSRGISSGICLPRGAVGGETNTETAKLFVKTHPLPGSVFPPLLMPLLAGLLLLCPLSLQAGLTWEQSTLETSVASRRGEVQVGFHYLNNEKRPVRIVGVVTCCNCLEVDRPTAPIEPGKSGILPVRYTAEGRLGLQEKTIEVLTDPPAPQRQVLTLRIQVDDPLYVDQENVFWSPGRPATPRTIRLRIRDKEALQLVGAQSVDPRIKLRLLEVEPGEVYHLEATPTSTAEMFLSEIHLTARDSKGQTVVVKLPAGVR